MRSNQTTRIIVFFAGLAILVGPNIYAWLDGYKAGFKSPVDIGSPFAFLQLIFIPWLFYLLIRTALDWGRKPVDVKIALFVLILFPQLICNRQGAYVFGSARAYSFLSRDQNHLWTVQNAVEEYRELHSVYPSSLDQLVPALLPAVPASQYGKNMKIQYAVAKDANSTRTKYLIWSPGPNEKYDIETCPQLTASISKLAEGDVPEWLCARAYDPTNGMLSPGDVIRYKKW